MKSPTARWIIACACLLLVVVTFDVLDDRERSGGDPIETSSEAPSAGFGRLPAAVEIPRPAVYQLERFDPGERRSRHPVEKGKPLRFAEASAVAISPDTHGRWEVQDGRAEWRLTIKAPGALNLNFGFGRFNLPASASLEILMEDGSQVVRPFTAADNEAHQQLWTPLVAGDAVRLVLRVSEAEREAVLLQLTSINRGFRDLSLAAGYEKIGNNSTFGDCYIDVNCTAAESGVGAVIDLYRDQMRSAGVCTLGGVDNCSGSLLNNTAQDGKPFFLTAHHCGVTAALAPSLVVYWNFQDSGCRAPGSSTNSSPGDGVLTDFNSGAILRATSESTDFTLVELDDPVDPGANAFFAGWSRALASPTSTVCIHHPSTAEKRISFDFDPAQPVSNEGDTTTSTNGSYWRVIDWDFGSTEGGSSGSPLFDQNGRVIGQLFGGDAACGNNLSDWYGRIARSWTGGGASSSRLSDWLDPLGTGALILDGIDSPPVVLAAAAELLEGDAGTSPMEFVLTLDKPATESIEVSYATSAGSALPGQDFVAVAGASVTFEVGETEKSVQVEIIGETTPEQHEEFTLQLGLVGSPAAALPQTTVVGTILNDDYVQPVITGPSSVSGAVGEMLSVMVTTLNTPTTFRLEGGPPGILVDDDGVIAWTPDVSGTFSVDIVASNPAGSDTASLTLSIASNPILEGMDGVGVVESLSTGGDLPWTREDSGLSVDGIDRVHSGTITHGQSSWVEVTVEGPDFVGFWWSVSSEESFDFLTLSVDGEVRTSISGAVDWEYRVVPLGPGTHTLRWEYSKDGSESEGLDRGWIDLVQVASRSKPFLMEAPVVRALRNQAIDYRFPTYAGTASFAPVIIRPGISLDSQGVVRGTPNSSGETNFTLEVEEEGAVLVVPAKLAVEVSAPVGSAVDQPHLLWWQDGFGSWGIIGQSALGSGTSTRAIVCAGRAVTWSLDRRLWTGRTLVLVEGVERNQL